MIRKKFSWKNRLLAVVVLLALIGVAGAFLLKGYVTPTVRETVDNPLFTVGDDNYERALDDGKNVVKFGRLPFGIYPGGVAFNDMSDASDYLKAIGKSESGWKIYVLSGDFELDTVLIDNQHYTNKSLLVVEQAADVINDLDFESFDQTPNSGWRLLADEKKYSEASEMIETYIASNPQLERQEVRILNFHAGQMYAFAGNYEIAKSRFELSKLEVEPLDSPIRWNAYVTATIAFLDDDKQTLEKCRAEIFEGPKIGGETPNLRVVNSFLRHLGQPYSVAYESQR